MDINSLSVAEHVHVTEMQEDLRRKLQESQRAEDGRVDSIRSSVLSKVVGEAYDRGKEELQNYVESRTEFPNFQARVERYVHHCCDLIQAINTKRNFPGLATLSLSKQQEIHERVLEHFEELKSNLRLIEKIERDHKLTDVRSTVWVLQSLTYCALGILLTGFLIDLNSAMFSSFIAVTESLVDSASSWVVNLIPL